MEKESTPRPGEIELPQLQLTVDIPPRWRPFLSDDLAEAFANRLTDIFRQRGYTGVVSFLDHAVPQSEVRVLSVRLINWRIGRPDNAECTFTASFKSGEKTHELDLFKNSSLVGNNNRERWSLAAALNNVADGALRDLSFRLSHHVRSKHVAAFKTASRGRTPPKKYETGTGGSNYGQATAEFRLICPSRLCDSHA